MWYAICTSICYILLLLGPSLIYQTFLVHKNRSEELINDDEAYGGWVVGLSNGVGVHDNQR